MANKVLNFDKFMQEKKGDTITVNVLGMTITVKSEIPAIVPIALARAEEGDGTQSAGMAIFKAADVMMGKETVDALCSKGMTAPDLAALLQQLFSMINGTDEPEEDEGILDGETKETDSPNA